MPKLHSFVLFRRCHRLPVGPQQEADDLLSEWTSAAAGETGLLLGHVSRSSFCSFCPPFFICIPLFFFLYCSFLKLTPKFPSPLCLSDLVSSPLPASCHTSSVSLTLGPSLSVTHLLSSSAPSTTSLHCCPVKRSSYPGKKNEAGP